MRTLRIISAGILLMSCPLQTIADSYADSPSCYRPSKPYEFTSQWEVDSFNDEVYAYKSCINDFIEEQQDGIDEHQEAINSAIEEWNNFVAYELG
jgi:hypothetical protein